MNDNSVMIIKKYIIFDCLETLIRACFGRYNSYRVSKLGMQDITELYQFISVIDIKKISPIFTL